MDKQDVKVIVTLEIDIDDVHFPAGDDGILIWTPEQCIEDYISHFLFKGHDATHMGELCDGITFKDWKITFPESIVRKMSRIMVEHFWRHPESVGGKYLHDTFSTLDDAKEMSKEAVEEKLKRFAEEGELEE